MKITMKKILSVILLVLFIPGTICCNVYADELRENILSVSGYYTVVAAADEAFVTIGVETSNTDYKLCQEENKNKMSNVTNAVLKLGIEERYIKTIEYNSTPIYEYVPSEEYTGIYYNGTYYNKRVFKEYKLTHKLRVMLTDVSLVGKLIDITVANGVNELNNVYFSLSKPKQHELYLQALEGASVRAKDKAAVLAKVFDIKKLNVKAITTSDYNAFDNYSYNSALMSKNDYAEDSNANYTNITSGEIQVSATVNIEYTY